MYASLRPDSLILYRADELIAQHQAKLHERGLELDTTSLEGNLAQVLATIVRLVREDFRHG